jgi:predicted metal-dependent hydrolase
VEKWWKAAVSAEDRLRESERRLEALWREKNELLEKGKVGESRPGRT